jgi:dienelactone hydrolase
VCVSEEFAKLEAGVLQAGVPRPIVDWLRALAAHVSGLHGGAKVGAIGMCLTGAFAIPLILER